MAASGPKNASRRLWVWQQTGDIYDQSTLRIGNRLVSPAWSFHIHGTAPLVWHSG